MNASTLKARTKLQIQQEALKKLANKREDRIDRYIIPIEIKMQELRDKIRESGQEPKYY